MKEQRYFFVPHAADTCELPEDEAKHAIRVLRMVPGDELFLIDGVGNFYEAVMEQVTNKKAFYHITKVLPQQPTWHGHIHLAIAPTKMTDRMEWLIEKAVEVGVDEVSFLDTAFSERKVLRTDRLEKIAVAAMKQSRKGWLTVINPIIPFDKFINKSFPGLKCMAHCYQEKERVDFFSFIQNINVSDSQDITVLIGPEGDFSIDEVEKAMGLGYTGVSLGTSRLRTETAGLASVLIAHLARRI